jgi:hypothetical protein
MRWILLAAAWLSLVSCTAMDRQACADYGYTEGTPDFGACMERRDENRAERMGAAAAIMATMPQYQPAPVYQVPVYQMPVQQPHSYSCYRTGNFVNCNGY